MLTIDRTLHLYWWFKKPEEIKVDPQTKGGWFKQVGKQRLCTVGMSNGMMRRYRRNTGSDVPRGCEVLHRTRVPSGLGGTIKGPSEFLGDKVLLS